MKRFGDVPANLYSRALLTVIAVHALSQQFPVMNAVILKTRWGHRKFVSKVEEIEKDGSCEVRGDIIHSKLSIMKKMLFLLLISIVATSCSKEIDFAQIANKKIDSSFIYVDYKPMPKGVVPVEFPKD